MLLPRPDHAVFDYRLLRLVMGLIAFLLPVIVDMRASEALSSISASYHTEARDLFVGLLFVVAALLMAYRGHTARENRGANLAALAAVLVALFPVPDIGQTPGWVAVVHYASAATLFSLLAWFCFGPFRERTRGRGGMKGPRARIYLLCGWTMVASMAGLAAAGLLLERDTMVRYGIIYWAEFIALWAFGVAWITAGKVLPFLTGPDDAWLGRPVQASS
jgi:hypothetical protein